MIDNFGFTKLSVVAGGVADVLKQGKVERKPGDLLDNCNNLTQARD